MVKPILPFLALILLASQCEPEVTFTEPQPKDVKAQKKFAASWHGRYGSLDGKTEINISNYKILEKADYNIKAHKNELDSGSYLLNDTTLIANKDTLRVKLQGDSIVYHANEVDTLFIIDKNHVLKKFKKSYFLSQKHEHSNWEVTKLHRHKDTLFLSHVYSEDDINTLKATSDYMQEDKPYQFNPSKQEFKHFLKKGGFKESIIYIKN